MSHILHVNLSSSPYIQAGPSNLFACINLAPCQLHVRAGIPVIEYVGSYDGEEKKREMRKMLEEVGCVSNMEHWDEFKEALERAGWEGGSTFLYEYWIGFITASLGISIVQAISVYLWWAGVPVLNTLYDWRGSWAGVTDSTWLIALFLSLGLIGFYPIELEPGATVLIVAVNLSQRNGLSKFQRRKADSPMNDFRNGKGTRGNLIHSLISLFHSNLQFPRFTSLAHTTTASGSKLITSGWLGRSRHPNYLGDLLMAQFRDPDRLLYSHVPSENSSCRNTATET
ncbi:hypothetical protein BDP27DRAFT_1356849 [Rhodocollybia butyracea]|uniref:Uncharacterized protein n=1 Tax=Rhodocollybia butyracea TaxID=206335 RepID=A0A9P5QBA5_9AGAR|nr:hypothetical protein BDP27DRAFT_1356849 [Rhodocollybia butyracea]